MTRRTTRRRYVELAAGIGFAAVAGCTDAGPGEDGGADANGLDDPESVDEEEAEEDEGTADHENPQGEVRFVAPADGDTVSSPVDVELEVDSFQLEPAEEPPPEEENATEEGANGDDEEGENGGDDGNEEAGDDGESDASETPEGHGHLHVIVDEGCFEPARAIPFTDGYHHLGDGGTEITIELEPGEHDLCAQASDGAHNAYDMTDEITIEVEDGADAGGNGSEENATEDENATDDGNATDD